MPSRLKGLSFPKVPTERYRNHYLKDDVTRSTIGILLIMVPLVAFVTNDYRLFGTDFPFYGLVALRAVILISGIGLLFYLRRIRSFRLYDGLLSGWGFIALTGTMLINLSRPPDTITNALFDVVDILALYVMFPTRLANIAGLCLYFTVGDIALMMVTRGQFIQPIAFTMIASFIFANMFGITAAWMMDGYRRREYLAREEEQKALADNRRLEDERQKAARLESIGTLAGGIAHDFNNLLTVILGNVSMAQGEKSGAERTKMLEEAVSASQRAAQLTRQLLTFARGGAPSRKRLDLAVLAGEAAAVPLKGFSGDFSLHAEPGLWPVDVDEGQFTQVIQNIVKNARESMTVAGNISIRVHNCNEDVRKAAGLREGRYVHLEVEDTGVGIPETEMARVFDPFYTTKAGGTGLGLSICYSVVSRHGGALRLESRVGKGTIARVFLPASASVGSASNAQKACPEPANVNKRVLLMDDEEAVRETGKAMLERLGMSVTLASEGTEAVNSYRGAMESGQPFGTVILDLSVNGGMGGMEALRHLISIDPGVRAVVSSGYADAKAVTDFRTAGFQAALVKPYTLDGMKALFSGSADA